MSPYNTFCTDRSIPIYVIACPFQINLAKVEVQLAETKLNLVKIKPEPDKIQKSIRQKFERVNAFELCQTNSKILPDSASNPPNRARATPTRPSPMPNLFGEAYFNYIS